MAQGPSVVPIPGTKTRRYLIENIEAGGCDAARRPSSNRLNALPPATGAPQLTARGEGVQVQILSSRPGPAQLNRGPAPFITHDSSNHFTR